MIKTVVFSLFLGFFYVGFGQRTCTKLLLEIEASFLQNSDAQHLVHRYEKSCFQSECENLCAFDALKIKYFRTNGDYESALSYGEKALLKSGHEKFKARILFEEAIVHYLNEDIGRAVKCLHKAISIEKIEDDIEAKSFLMLGNAHKFLGNTNYAIRYYSKTYKVALKIVDSSLVSSALNGQGLIAYSKGNRNSMKRAISLFNRSLRFLNDRESEQSLILLNNIAAAYLNLKEYNKAEKYFLECAKLYSIKLAFEDLVSTYNNLVAIFMETSQWAKAKEYLDNNQVLNAWKLLLAQK